MSGNTISSFVTGNAHLTEERRDSLTNTNKHDFDGHIYHKPRKNVAINFTPIFLYSVRFGTKNAGLPGSHACMGVTETVCNRMGNVVQQRQPRANYGNIKEI
jgi:hypothetical protein